MSSPPTDAEPQRPRMNFRRSQYGRTRMPADSARRQGEITQLAFALLGGRDGALTFLNGSDAALGGRPLDVAIASDEGFATIAAAIHRMAEPQGTGT